MNDGMNIGMIDMHIEDWFIDIAILYLVRRLYDNLLENFVWLIYLLLWVVV